MDTIYKLKKKYGGSIAEILAYYDKISEEYQSLELSDELTAHLQRELDEANLVLHTVAEALTACRLAAAAEFSERVEQELAYLDMAGVRFSITRREKPYGPTGADEMEFMICTNTGEEAKPLAKIASGGELARIMLAMKNVLAAEDSVGTMIFDEVDTGVSGRAAQKVAYKLWTVAKGRQVLCVTHLPQIAAMADTEFTVEKRVENERTYTSVLRLDAAGRRQELARLIGGSMITETTLAGAAELLRLAEQTKKGASHEST